MGYSSKRSPRAGISLALLAGGLSISGIYPASGHSWYSAECCSERDCKPLTRESTVTPVRGGYSIVAEPGGAPVFFPQEKVRPSQDGDYHACIGPTSGVAFCLYVPAGA